MVDEVEESLGGGGGDFADGRVIRNVEQRVDGIVQMSRGCHEPEVEVKSLVVPDSCLSEVQKRTHTDGQSCVCGRSADRLLGQAKWHCDCMHYWVRVSRRIAPRTLTRHRLGMSCHIHQLPLRYHLGQGVSHVGNALYVRHASEPLAVPIDQWASWMKVEDGKMVTSATNRR